MQATLKPTARNEKSKRKNRPSESVQKASMDNGGRNKTMQTAALTVPGDTEHTKPEERFDEINVLTS